MTEEPVVFSTVAEGARKAFGPRLTPALMTKLKAVGFDLEQLQPAYALAPFLEAIGVLADELFPDQATDEQLRRVGREFMAGYKATTVGFATLTMARVIGLKRTFLRMGRNLRTTGNYLDVDTEDVGPTEVVVKTRVRHEFRSAISPAQLAVINGYRIGVFEGTFEAFATQGEVTLDGPTDRPEVAFRLRW
ncbi:MAG: DUF2378 family protein [Myxococcaceae bacterium]|nr:DUF2378 family protein [Myxococcaceae bacterium]